MHFKLLLIAKIIPRSSTGSVRTMHRPIWWPCKPCIGERFNVSNKDRALARITVVAHLSEAIEVHLEDLDESLAEKLLAEKIGWTETLLPLSEIDWQRTKSPAVDMLY